MELKQYQQQVIDDLENYLDVLLSSRSLNEAFQNYWKYHKRYPLAQDQIVPYHDKISGIPNVCIKVPTAGGKTFIAVNALKPIFGVRKLTERQARLVVWLVPSESILMQTLTNLRNPEHPYHQKLLVHFGNNINILDKEQVLRGNDFDADTVVRGISILIMTFDSLKINKEKLKAFHENPKDPSLKRSKEMLRAYRENPNLASFEVFRLPENDLAYTDNSALISVLRYMKPVVVVDESHNANTSLSEEMLLNLNPCFILELTATPRENSNIISYVDALALHNEQMIKLPLMVSQQNNQNDVMMAALTLRHNLESLAVSEQSKGGSYIRPIILFQAEPRSKDDNSTFEKVKDALLEIGIPEKEIAIKTSEINELKNVDLLSPDCEIRYVITVNALKEGWDCSFAYILASLANKSSIIDVTQIVGRILRQPYARWHSKKLLNSSFVFSSSEKFHETLRSLEIGLVNAGFSRRDYRIANTDEGLIENSIETISQPELTLTASEPPEPPENVELILPNTFKLPERRDFIIADNPVSDQVSELESQAIEANIEFSKQAQAAVFENAPPIELANKISMYPMRSEFIEMMKTFSLPQFVIKIENHLFNETTIFDKNNLLENFPLNKCDANIDFGQVQKVVYASEFKNEKEVEFNPLKHKEKQELINLFVEQSDETQQENLVENLFQLAGRRAFYPISDAAVRSYFRRIIEDMSDVQRQHCFEHLDQYYKVIKNKIDVLIEEFAEREFFNKRTKDELQIEPAYSFKASISPSSIAPSFGKSLYEREGEISSFEATMLRKILEDDEIDIIWWHRNESRKGFYINSFLNHYPDFLLLTRKGTLIALETKGDQLDGSKSQAKIRAGIDWANAANQLNNGFRYRYMMLFEREKIKDAFDLSTLLNVLRSL